MAVVEHSRAAVVIPEQIETDRFILRRPCEADLGSYFAAWFETFDHIKPWFGAWAREAPTIEKVAASIRDAMAEWNDRKSLTYLCFDKETGELVGRAFFSRLDWDVPKGMLGYWVRKKYQRSGVGSEMIRALVDAAFAQMKFNRLELYVDPRNNPAVNFAERLGFLYEGRIRNYSLDNFGVMRDYLVYAMTPSDFSYAVHPVSTSIIPIDSYARMSALVV
ncbi:MAG: GNAT family N-acetyltransferase [Candidatus Obscuribacterales bacterium]|nr:GNAT family N-acetyltransferase [Candidatus Obscuribacterales bacterium]